MTRLPHSSLARECGVIIWTWSSYPLPFYISHRSMWVMIRLGPISYRSSAPLMHLCSASARPVAVSTSRILIGLVFYLAVTSFRGLSGPDLSLGTTLDPSMGTFSRVSDLLLRLAARTALPPFAAKERLSRSGGIPFAMRLLVGGDLPLRPIYAIGPGWVRLSSGRSLSEVPEE